MKITVIGTGYVGLVSGTCFSETGNQVTCVDIDSEKVSRLQRGEITIYEPGLEPIFSRNLRQGRLHFTTDLAAAVDGAEIIFLALPTPMGEDGSADLSYVLGVARELTGLIKSYTLVVDKSTVPVGTADQVHAILAERLDEGLFDVVSNPEFLREGAAVDDFMKPDRVVIGTRSTRARELMDRLYEPFVRQGNPIIHMDERSAELTKYAANAYLATRISFMNEIANLCERVGADVDYVRRGIGSDSRIGKRFLFPGVGYGGSCFPKDVNALFSTSKNYDYNFRILNSVINVNNNQRMRVYDKIREHFQGQLEGLKIAMWGLAFKPNTDDIREAPALYTIDALVKEGVELTVYDPEAMGHVRSLYGDEIRYAEDMYGALAGADALAIMTEWNVFRTPDFNRMRELLAAPLIIDGRNLYAPESMSEWKYLSIGR